MTYETATATCNVNYWVMPNIRVIIEVPDIIIDNTCRVFKIERHDLFSSCRKWDLVRARNICMYLIRTYTKLSLKDIGKLFNRDHTTVIHAMRYVKNELTTTHYRYQMNQDLIEVISKSIEERKQTSVRN